ncbi:imidazolonepropionase [Clostridium polynesiense]|uniref:imidazolonepropionase n=1 Tax=Clostridium polynesiense TaxID=1325933 RepID=UPI00058F371B|nr:imidazolonepropionase [Clostridium polynesiense]
MRNNLIIKNIGELVTCSGFTSKKGSEMQELHILKDVSIIVEKGVIKEIISSKEQLGCDFENYEIIDAEGCCVLPGFVDSHTHFIFSGYREEEFYLRVKGTSYMEIMKRGGGIANTVNNTREASKEELIELGKRRLDDMLKMGITTVEGKSGYGLDLNTEVLQLKAMKDLDKSHAVDIVSTFLGAHALPKEYTGRKKEYLDFIINEVLPIVTNEELAEFCDVFCEKNVFEVDESRYLLERAKSMGMKLKLHADEIEGIGGTELACELKAVSADHLLQASDNGIKALAASNTIATLLPCTAFSLKESYARGRKMIDEGCAVALATDFNPGSCFTQSIPLLIALACYNMNLSLEEVINALTINGAAALNREKIIGSIDKGKQADLIILKYPSYKFMLYNLGTNIVNKVIKKGVLVKEN